MRARFFFGFVAWFVFVLSAVLTPSPSLSEADTPLKHYPVRPGLAPLDGKIYTGAYVDFGDREDTVTLEGIERFDSMVGHKQAVIGFSSDWGNGIFPAKQLAVIYNYGAVALVYWSPWDRPISAPRAQNRFHLAKVLDGSWDGYIDEWARQAKSFGKPILVAWGLEMNGQWFPWSGYFYGAGAPAPGGGFQGPETFKKTYRYVVDRVRARGATNVFWVFHANNTSDPDEPWNVMANYYPGPDYADWLAMSAYGMQYPDQYWLSVKKVFDEPYANLAALDPKKPIVLAEWGVGEFPKLGSKGEWITEAVQRFEADYSRIRASVFWHERWQNSDLRYSNLRANSSAEALDAYRQAMRRPAWVDRPVIK